MKRELKNIPASVHRRLLDKAKRENRPFNELFQYYAIERFLYRFGQSKHTGKAVLKGAMMFLVWDAPYARATRDIDMLGRLNNSRENVLAMVRDVCAVEDTMDGMTFEANSVRGERIDEDGNYKGVRVTFEGFLGKAQAHMQIDFGFGDEVFPEPRDISYPTIFDMPAPALKGYPKESVIAEKYHVLMNLGIINTRMKDFYDIWLLANQFDFDSDTLEKSIVKTFEHRNTAISSPEALLLKIASNADKNAQWRAFVRKSGLSSAPEEISDVVCVLKNFLAPITAHILAAQKTTKIWKAPGPWKQK